MAEFEWEKQAGRQEVAALLRQIADGLDAGGSVELEQDGWELKVRVPDELTVEIEFERGDDETELEVELTWSNTGSQAARREPGEESAEEARGL